MTRFSFRAFRFATRCPGGRGGLHQLPSTAKPAAAKREAPQCDDHPDDLRTIRHGTAVTNLQKGKACPKAGQNRRLHRSADPRRAEARTRRSASKRSFLLDRAQPVFFSTRGKRKWGVHPAGPAPCGSRIPRGRRTAAHPMLPPHVAPPQQIICGHVEVIRQGHQFLIVRAAVAALIALVGTQLDTQNFPHVLLIEPTGDADEDGNKGFDFHIAYHGKTAYLADGIAQAMQRDKFIRTIVITAARKFFFDK